MPTVNIVGIDKVVHFVMHLLFTSLWGMAFLKSGYFSKISSVLGFSFLFSFFFGLLIEAAQAFLTTSRSGDFTDVLANSVGALLAVAFLNSYANHSKEKS